MDIFVLFFGIVGILGTRAETSDAQRDICILDKDRGPCDVMSVRYFYNKVTGSCEQFLYGGCRGNGNKFRTRKECQSTCTGTPDTDCDQANDEVFMSCGTACPLTCENHNEQPLPCTEQCVSGCFCKEELLRRFDGKCVKPNECWTYFKAPVQKCNPERNEVFHACGTACPLTCENYHEAPLICNKKCFYGCFCKDDLIRRFDGQCVQAKECQDKMPRNETLLLPSHLLEQNQNA